ncbi:hypothetical protein BJ508DRAFT_333281 [Ascobolus immersus RN42]|uniref:Uncharacterized protein n=1 Tax=Ascobolus immersus RN42 TaxID=1160509 RepID=A0A3N4HK44_ASCIM|nr:hypothetical protein BJ508DRAFT_333281 [Ascobolus immersus RN42]
MTKDDKKIDVYLPSTPQEDSVHCYVVLAEALHAWDVRVTNPDGIAFRAWLLAKYQQGVLEIHRGPGPNSRREGGKGDGKKVQGA